MPRPVQIIAGNKPPKKRYKAVAVDKLAGKKIEAVGRTTVDGAYGDEPCINLYFADGTRHGFVLPRDEDDWPLDKL